VNSRQAHRGPENPDVFRPLARRVPAAEKWTGFGMSPKLRPDAARLGSLILSDSGTYSTQRTAALAHPIAVAQCT
jgi:hypothetical protein